MVVHQHDSRRIPIQRPADHHPRVDHRPLDSALTHPEPFDDPLRPREQHRPHLLVRQIRQQRLENRDDIATPRNIVLRRPFRRPSPASQLQRRRDAHPPRQPDPVEPLQLRETLSPQLHQISPHRIQQPASDLHRRALHRTRPDQHPQQLRIRQRRRPATHQLFARPILFVPLPDRPSRLIGPLFHKP